MATTGKWKKDRLLGEICGDNTWRILGNGGRPVATVHEEGDADLIALVPEMVAAIRSVLELTEEYTEQYPANRIAWHAYELARDLQKDLEPLWGQIWEAIK